MILSVGLSLFLTFFLKKLYLKEESGTWYRNWTYCEPIYEQNKKLTLLQKLQKRMFVQYTSQKTSEIKQNASIMQQQLI
jgi:hypothetical protein